jgi:hypothetical protein
MQLWADQTLPTTLQFEYIAGQTPDGCHVYFSSDRDGVGQRLFKGVRQNR